MPYSAADALQANAALIKPDASDDEINAVVDNLLRNADNVVYNEVDNTIRIGVSMAKIREGIAPKRMPYVDIVNLSIWAKANYSPLKWTVKYASNGETLYFYAKVVA